MCEMSAASMGSSESFEIPRPVDGVEVPGCGRCVPAHIPLRVRASAHTHIHTRRHAASPTRAALTLALCEAAMQCCGRHLFLQ